MWRKSVKPEHFDQCFQENVLQNGKFLFDVEAKYMARNMNMNKLKLDDPNQIFVLIYALDLETKLHFFLQNTSMWIVHEVF